MSSTKVSIVTISFNQHRFLERAILSVVRNGYENVEYIIVDPGSTDGSRELIENYRHYCAHVVFEKDQGAADGLNKGFARATGEILAFLNSDDILYPGAIRAAVDYLQLHHHIDVVSGHAKIIDTDDHVLRLGYSDRFDLRRFAHGGSVLMQPSTFFRRQAFDATEGFNVANCCSWDAELWADMALNGLKFGICNDIWSGFRLHSGSITASGRLGSQAAQIRPLIFRKIMKREQTAVDKIVLTRWYKLVRKLLNPRDTYQRLLHGTVYRRDHQLASS